MMITLYSKKINYIVSHLLSLSYVRDEFLRSGIFMETFETCVRWSSLKDLHDNVSRKIKESIDMLLYKDCFYILTKRFTHLYPDGVSIYFTLIVDPRKQWKERFGRNYKDYLKSMFVAWSALKNEIQECVVSNMGSATHHHAVGKDHAESFAFEVGKQNMDWMIALKKHFDPN